jgi:hypothetical protein
MFGSDLAKRLCARCEGTPLGESLASLAPEIEDDRRTLLAIMQRSDISRNRLKQATTWLAEKASRVKFRGETGTFTALETLSLGVQGKLALWIALREVADPKPGLDPDLLDRLIERARAQWQLLERERIQAAKETL